MKLVQRWWCNSAKDFYLHHQLLCFYNLLPVELCKWWREGWLQLRSCFSLDLLHFSQSVSTVKKVRWLQWALVASSCCSRGRGETKPEQDGLPYLSAGEVTTTRQLLQNILLLLFRECQSIRKGELSILRSCLLFIHVVAQPNWRQGKSHKYLPHTPGHLIRWGWSWRLWVHGTGRRTHSWIHISGGG